MSNFNNEMYHFGIPGMKWGVRRYQNKDGSLTPAGKKRADKLKDEYTNLTGKKLIRKPGSKSDNSKEIKEDLTKPKSVKDMSDNELRERTNRITLENNYNIALQNMANLNPKQVSKGEKFVKKMFSDVIEPAATDVAKQVVKSWLVDMTNKGLKLDDELKVYTNNKKKN